MTQCDRILEKLTRAGAAGVSNFQLNNLCFRYGARLMDLRKRGYVIDSKHIKGSEWRFTLLNPDVVREERPQSTFVPVFGDPYQIRALRKK
jgi:hypothetical protein